MTLAPVADLNLKPSASVTFVIACPGTPDQCLGAIRESGLIDEPAAEVLLVVAGDEAARRLSRTMPPWINVIAAPADADFRQLRRIGAEAASGDAIRLLEPSALHRESVSEPTDSSPQDWQSVLAAAEVPHP